MSCRIACFDCVDVCLCAVCRKPLHDDPQGDSSCESLLLEDFSMGQPVVTKSGYNPVPATEGNLTSSMTDVTKGEFWFIAVARASRQQSTFIYFALIVPAFQRPEDWPKPTQAALHLVQLEGISQGKHGGCQMLKTANDKCDLLKGLVDPDARWRSPYAVQSALWRAKGGGASNSTHGPESARDGDLGNEPASSTETEHNDIPKNLYNFGYKRLLKAATPKLDKVCAILLAA